MDNQPPSPDAPTSAPGPLRESRRALPIQLLRAREVVMARFRPFLAAHEVTEQQWRVLRVLSEVGPEGGLDATELAARACILAPSLSRIGHALERRGLILRERDRSDGRRLLVSITPDGRRLIEAARPGSEAIYAELEQRFGPRRMTALLELLDELIALDAPRR